MLHHSTVQIVMKQLFFLISCCAFLLLSCTSHPTVHRENGWYLAASADMDSIALEPIATVHDFNELRLDSDAFGRYVITGRISPHKQADWADQTEKAIGRCLAFVFNDTVICCPKVHARIESGNFQVSSSPTVRWICLPFTAASDRRRLPSLRSSSRGGQKTPRLRKNNRTPSLPI